MAALLVASRAVSAAPSVDAARFLRQDSRYADGVRVTGVQAGGATVALELRRFEVFARNVDLRVDDGHGHVRHLPRPSTRYYTGHVEGAGDSAVFLAVEPDGGARGIVDRAGEAASLLADARTPLHTVAIDTSAPRSDGGFHCGNDELAEATALVGAARSAVPTPAALRDGRPYRVRAAIETDYEFYQKFPDADHALAYVGDLIGYASTRYLAQVDTRLEVVFVRLWSSADDPWAETTTLCGLFELGKYWNTNMGGVSRSLVHMLSGRRTGGGQAWIGALCAAPGSIPVGGNCATLSGSVNVLGDYGFSGNLAGNFDPAAPQMLWDSMAPAHEIGHSFNSPHTHCYNGIGGNADPVDQCYSGESGCYGGSSGLPGPGGQGSGTLMSYCHLLSGGLANLSMTFGTGHPYGVAPERVPQRMRAYVDGLAQSQPECVVDDTLFADGFDG